MEKDHVQISGDRLKVDRTSEKEREASPYRGLYQVRELDAQQRS